MEDGIEARTMRTRRHAWYSLAPILILLGSSGSAFGQEAGGTLIWSMQPEKRAYCPGEPVALTVRITNTSGRAESVDFGMDGIEAFSFELRNDANECVASGGKIIRPGLARVGMLNVGPGETTEKSIVLNQWCSTLLPPGVYAITCTVEYWLVSDATVEPGSGNALMMGSTRKTEFGATIELVACDDAKRREILVALAERAEQEPTSRPELLARMFAQELLVFAEWEAAVPYQADLLITANIGSWLRQDAIQSLVKSETLEATNALMTVVRRRGSFEDVYRHAIAGVYTLRDTSKPEILSATEAFVAEHERPPAIPLPTD